MAKVLVENTREHPIDINFFNPATKENEVISVPPCKIENNEKQNGWLEVDADALKAARENKGVEAYFSVGYLAVTGEVAEEQPAKQPAKK